jgi:hypothetical protein
VGNRRGLGHLFIWMKQWEAGGLGEESVAGE